MFNLIIYKSTIRFRLGAMEHMLLLIPSFLHRISIILFDSYILPTNLKILFYYYFILFILAYKSPPIISQRKHFLFIYIQLSSNKQHLHLPACAWRFYYFGRNKTHFSQVSIFLGFASKSKYKKTKEWQLKNWEKMKKRALLLKLNMRLQLSLGGLLSLLSLLPLREPQFLFFFFN